jgi:hypothetical protein
MLDNSITLTVDEANDGSTTADVDLVYTRYDEYQNRSLYTGENHSLTAKDTIGFYRTFPKTSGNFRGMAKSAVKLTADQSVAGVDQTSTVVAPAIIDLKFAFPVGMSAADTKKLRMRAVAMLLDDTVMVPLHDQLMV